MKPTCKLCGRAPESNQAYPAEVWISVEGRVFCGDCWRRTAEQIARREAEEEHHEASAVREGA